MLYVKEGDALEARGQAFSVEEKNIAPWLKRKLDGTDLEVAEGTTVEDARAAAEAEGVEFKYHLVTEEDYEALRAVAVERPEPSQLIAKEQL
jgi:hypothetical protein